MPNDREGRRLRMLAKSGEVDREQFPHANAAKEAPLTCVSTLSETLPPHRLRRAPDTLAMKFIDRDRALADAPIRSFATFCSEGGDKASIIFGPPTDESLSAGTKRWAEIGRAMPDAQDFERALNFWFWGSLRPSSIQSPQLMSIAWPKGYPPHVHRNLSPLPFWVFDGVTFTKAFGHAAMEGTMAQREHSRGPARRGVVVVVLSIITI